MSPTPCVKPWLARPHPSLSPPTLLVPPSPSPTHASRPPKLSASAAAAPLLPRPSLLRSVLFDSTECEEWIREPARVLLAGGGVGGAVAPEQQQQQQQHPFQVNAGLTMGRRREAAHT